ncbi:MAG: hypothetical protein P1P90_06760 [Patescibacteria group bacterium]|nr:hypothetical protein [Patescibacteria group bacterium]
MNFDTPEPSIEKPELPPELIRLAKSGIHSAQEIQDSYTEVLELMDVRGIADDEKSAYRDILNAKKELHDHELALTKYLQN